ncbi:uncharacterized protein [Rutidosis leptorrhynchoides]|uniref:uncharacterized protein n=1 Tax=Rutidosis leptorrhynchoides TaxID=125765 RepID=UPI003A99AFC3
MSGEDTNPNSQLITELTSHLARLLQSNNENQAQRLPDSLKINVNLNNSNFSLWSRMIKVAIGGKSETLLNHLTEDPPAINNQKWNQDDLVVFSWIIQNIEPQIATSNLTQFPTAKLLWNALITTYSSGKDKLQTFDLHVKANNIKQEGKSIEDLWLKLQGIWGEIETRDPNPMEHPNDIIKYNNIRAEQKLFQFLNALDHKHDNIKRELLRIEPLPTVEGAYAAIRKENAHQSIFSNKIEPTNNSGIASGLIAPTSKTKETETDGHGLYSRNQRRSNFISSKDKDKLVCEECGMKRHTKDQCFRRVGYPEWWNDGHKKGKASIAAGVAATKSNQETADTTTAQGGFGLMAAEEPASSSQGGGNLGLGLGLGSIPKPDRFTDEKGIGFLTENRFRLLQNDPSNPSKLYNPPCVKPLVKNKPHVHTNLHNSPSISTIYFEQSHIFKENSKCQKFLQSRSFPTKNVSHANVMSNKIKNKEWIIDCGATDTMTFDKTDFYSESKSNKTQIKTANGGSVQVKGGGTIEISPTLKLKNCLYVPALSHKLLSVSHVTKELNCTVLLHPTFCILQDIRTGKIVGRGTERDGLYYVDEVTQDGAVMLAHGTPNRQAWLWHRRLGHPSAGYLKILFPNLFSSNKVIECETCILAKSHQSSFKTSNSKSEQPFTLIHSDVWGPARGESESNDSVSWLDLPSSEEVPHSIPPTSTSDNDLPNTTEVSSEFITPVTTNLESEVDSLVQETGQTEETCHTEEQPHQQRQPDQPVEPETEPPHEQYVLPPRVNRGIPPKRYSPERENPRSRYPMANVVKGNLSQEAKQFTSAIYSEKIPNNVEEALKSPVWRKAMEDEMKALMENNTWERCTLPESKKTVGCRWIQSSACGKRIVGKLIYLAHTRPDIAHAVGVVSQFMHQPQHHHMEAVWRIIKYLKGTAGDGVLFSKNNHLETQVYTDAGYGGEKGDRKSTSGYFSLVGGNLVTWKSKKQKVVALSSAEAEFRGIARGVTEALWIRKLLTEIGFPPKVPIKIMCDNEAAIAISENPVQHDRTKHIEIDRYFIKEKLETEIISLPFVRSEDQLADILTKSVNGRLFRDILFKLNIENPTIQLAGEC